MIEQNDGSRFQIDRTAGEVVNAHNRLVEAKKSGEPELQAEAMQSLLRVLANEPGAIEVLVAAQES